MISVRGLTKTYGGFLALDDVSFDCQPGRVTGFLGPNGAGKTTTMRIMVDLTPADRGEIRIGGHRYHQIPNPGRHVGVLLDASAQHAGRTGREVLTIGAQTMGLPSSRVDEMLELVSLSPEEAKRRVRNYSLGMRQRLGIAHALLGDPSVLVLDEPANGLDPAGIRWMRGLLKGYAERGGTVLLSSHLLNEVELIADEMILIGRGRIVAQGDKKSLLAGADHQATLVTSLDNDALARALRRRRATRWPPPATGCASRPPRSRSAAPPPSTRSCSPTSAPEAPASRTSSSSSPPTPSATRSPPAPKEPRHDRHPGLHADPRRSPSTSAAPRGRRSPGWSRSSCARWPTPGPASGCCSPIVLVTLAIVVIFFLAADEADRTFINFMGATATPQSFLLPVLGILLVTSEWGQRTTLTTFALEPHRGRVIAAKVVAALLFGLAAIVVGGGARRARHGPGRRARRLGEHRRRRPRQVRAAPGQRHPPGPGLRPDPPQLGRGDRALLRAPDGVLDRGQPVGCAAGRGAVDRPRHGADAPLLGHEPHRRGVGAARHGVPDLDRAARSCSGWSA